MQLPGIALVLASLALSGCDYAPLARPSVVEQLEPPVVRLINELPEVDRPNEALVTRIYATGGLARATVGDDGIMRGEVWARPARAHVPQPRRGEARGLPAQQRRAPDPRAAGAHLRADRDRARCARFLLVRLSGRQPRRARHAGLHLRRRRGASRGAARPPAAAQPPED